MKKLMIVICVMIVILAVLIAAVAMWLSTILLNLPDTRGLSVSEVDSCVPAVNQTNVYVRNTGRESVFITRFYDENNNTIVTASWYDKYQSSWNGTCHELYSGKYVALFMVGQQFYAREIYVEFYDGYKCRLWKFS